MSFIVQEDLKLKDKPNNNKTENKKPVNSVVKRVDGIIGKKMK